MNYGKLDNTKYITPQEVADYLHLGIKAVRKYFIQGKRVKYLKTGHKYLILRSSFEEWEEAHSTKVVRHW